MIELTPGPNMAYLAMVGSRWGRRAGAASVAGVTCGLLFYMILAVLGLGETILRAPQAYALLRWSGVAYLGWLAVQTWRGGAETSPGHADGAPNRGRLFGRGLLANLLNPKAAVFYVALLPSFTNPARGDLASQALTLGVIHVAVSVLVHSAIVLGAGGLRPWLAARDHGGVRRQVDHVFALGLAAISIWLAWETARPA